MKQIRTALASLVLMAALPAFAGTFNIGPSGKTFMWKVERGDTTLYLLGSIHALKEDAYPLPPAIEAAFAEAEIAVFEIDLDDMTKAAIKMMAAGSLEKGRTLEEVVGPETWAEFETQVRESGFDASLFQGMKPWMAALTVAAFELTQHGYLATAGLDTYFSRRADETGKERMALETADFQVSLFADLSPDQSLAFLRYTLEDLATMMPEMEQLYLGWRTGDVKSVEALLLEGFEEFPDVFEKMVVSRNRAWTTQIERLLAGDRDAIVVVGSAHLVGEGGVVNLLRKKGYKVQQQ
jgi:uncharacterized protein YbaP (TraB family)